VELLVTKEFNIEVVVPIPEVMPSGRARGRLPFTLRLELTYGSGFVIDNIFVF
jgi:hypothetical protein